MINHILCHVHVLIYLLHHYVADSRNSLGCDMLFIHKYNKLYSFARTLYEKYLSASDIDIDKEVL